MVDNGDHGNHHSSQRSGRSPSTENPVGNLEITSSQPEHLLGNLVDHVVQLPVSGCAPLERPPWKVGAARGCCHARSDAEHLRSGLGAVEDQDLQWRRGRRVGSEPWSCAALQVGGQWVGPRQSLGCSL